MVLTLEGDVNDEQAIEEIPSTWDETLASNYLDCIVDASRLTGAVSWDVVPTLAEAWKAFKGEPSGRVLARVVLVSGHPAFQSLARAVGVQFPNRQVYAAGTLEDAHAILDGTLQQAPCA